jgi:putative tryptophan/tyrosine transport system substrate-binding protein
MTRRQFITLLGGAAAAWPLAARAQQPEKMLRVGALSAQPRTARIWLAFERRMAELGYKQGTNFALEFVQVESIGDYEHGYRELVARKVDIMLANGPEIALKSARAATQTLPMVMLAIEYDPIARGYVTSLARPAGNITGMFLQQIELAEKRVQILKDAFPDLRAAIAFWDGTSADQWSAAQTAATTLGFQLAGVQMSAPPYDYTRPSRQPHCDGVSVLLSRPRAACRVRAATSDCVHVWLPRMGRGRWPVILRTQHRRAAPSGR